VFIIYIINCFFFFNLAQYGKRLDTSALREGKSQKQTLVEFTFTIPREWSTFKTRPDRETTNQNATQRDPGKPPPSQQLSAQAASHSLSEV